MDIYWNKSTKTFHLWKIIQLFCHQKIIIITRTSPIIHLPNPWSCTTFVTPFSSNVKCDQLCQIQVYINKSCDRFSVLFSSWTVNVYVQFYATALIHCGGFMCSCNKTGLYSPTHHIIFLRKSFLWQCYFWVLGHKIVKMHAIQFCHIITQFSP